ncbi:hypothetical protein PanWU01x14_246550 [Parasponia andersonii]|uniref:Uncharacterized protein n=1 Tax=Parasponia andersonii TaxID=3476 RepID=A0A2P5BEI2_PARAD|nr:hypothetical protein PanWU01x14_246550 [Parasponia andersonii]
MFAKEVYKLLASWSWGFKDIELLYNLIVQKLITMVVHNVTLVIDGMQLDPWKIDSDYASYTWLVDEIRKDLYGAQQLNFEVSFDIEGKVRRGEYMVEVVDDRSLMRLLNLNTNPIHVIELIVRTKVMHPVQVAVNDGDDERNGYETEEMMVNVPVNEVVGLSSPTDDSDFEYKIHDATTEEEESDNEVILDFLESEAKEVYYDSDDPLHMPAKSTAQDDNKEVNPSEGLPRPAKERRSANGKVELALWQVYNNYKEFGQYWLEFAITTGFERLNIIVRKSQLNIEPLVVHGIFMLLHLQMAQLLW